MYAIVAECEANIPQITPQDIQQEFTGTVSHELAEAATDPDVGIPKYTYNMYGNDAWATDTRGGEVGDLCENQPGVVEDNWSLARIWNAVAAKASKNPCQPVSNPVYYSAVPHTVAPGKSLGGAPNSDGYVVAKKGTTTNIEVDVFSTAPLPNPLTLVATRGRGFGGGPNFDPTAVTAVTKGVTMTWSQPTATNGDKVTLSITVDPAAASSTTGSKFVIRSVLSPTDYNSWPVILYIP
jgi:hypothetical protein